MVILMQASRLLLRHSTLTAAYATVSVHPGMPTQQAVRCSILLATINGASSADCYAYD
jgi:hypothetical protein